MASINVFDQADEFRIEIEGRFGGDLVKRVKDLWKIALLENSPRRFTVDITSLSGYDVVGCRLLRDMYRHGTYVSARNPEALAFLEEISSSKTGTPAVVYQTVGPKKGASSASVTVISEGRRAVAGRG